MSSCIGLCDIATVDLRSFTCDRLLAGLEAQRRHVFLSGAVSSVVSSIRAWSNCVSMKRNRRYSTADFSGPLFMTPMESTTTCETDTKKTRTCKIPCDRSRVWCLAGAQG